MDLDFLDTGKAVQQKPKEENKPDEPILPITLLEKHEKVSTGNSGEPVQKAAIVYSPDQATLEHQFTLPRDRLYLQRAITYAASHGWLVVPTLKEAIERRQGIRVNPGPAGEKLSLLP